MNKAPSEKPMAAGIAFSNPSPPLISMAGLNKDQKLAAIITPPVNPNIPSNTERFMLLKKKTNEAPAAVNNQVKVVANNAPQTGSISEKYETMASIIHAFREETVGSSTSQVQI